MILKGTKRSRIELFHLSNGFHSAADDSVSRLVDNEHSRPSDRLEHWHYLNNYNYRSFGQYCCLMRASSFRCAAAWQLNVTASC